MSKLKDKLGNFTMSINSLTPDPSDPTIKQAKMSIFTIDEVSGNHCNWKNNCSCTFFRN